jgi:hypothetical protein
VPRTTEKEPLSPANWARSGRSLRRRKPACAGDELVEALRRRDVGDADPEVVDGAPFAQRAVVYGLGAVSVRVEQERPVVVAAVLRARPGRSVVAVARGRPDLPELVGVRAEGATNPTWRPRVTGFPSVASASEKSSHSGKCSSVCVFSMPSVPRTVS